MCFDVDLPQTPFKHKPLFGHLIVYLSEFIQRLFFIQRRSQPRPGGREQSIAKLKNWEERPLGRRWRVSGEGR